MPDSIVELLMTGAARDKLGRRGITPEEACQLLHNVHVVVRNPRAETIRRRRLLVGRSDGGRSLTIVVERANDPTTWLVVTGWCSTPRERRLIRS